MITPPGHPPVYDMYDVAESRLLSVTKRLLKENIFEAYDDVLRQWQRDGIIETIPEDEISNSGHYLPHRPVIKPSSATTKVRPVFDASLKRTGYASLNECLSVGPSLSECWALTGVRDQESQSVLGIKWDTETDELYCVSPQVDIGFSEIVSKRKLLSILSSIYDPIGFTSPATLLPKLLLQEAWNNKLDWDEELPSDMQLRYQRWAKHLDLVEKCRIPRRVLCGSAEKATLHIFTDASAYGYACCVFLRCEEEEEVSLVLAKARVAPVKRLTIPRLELLGAAIGARIASTISDALKFPLKTYFWTDSMIVLGWITNREPWNTFVGNRIKEIRELTNVEDWRFVPGDINPADLPFRACDWSELLRSRWWEGPK
ncbi:hypothetical protein AVEN_145245-1 [Araneus ventricosus]|uniref:Uncharacterized protein n=1 Tax=Araneus ventricosus TaxID=182803 RepID=A0A4Y2THY9_ARAVE|nr:hypothetical protein AVEN_145245-1 [Araneus ventricosus]